MYGRILSQDFLLNWDDDKYVVHNEMVRGITLRHLKEAFTTFYFSNYAPLHLISYMVDHSLWGLKPAGFKLVNLLLHAANAMLLYLLVIRLHGRKAWAGVAAAIFLLHPVQVESVAWISQRKTLLAMFFTLGAVLAYHSWREQRRHGAYVFSVLAALLALLSKSVAVVVAPVLFLLDVCFAGGKNGRRPALADKIPYVLAVGLFALLACLSQERHLDSGGRTFYHGGSPRATFLTMLPVVARYLGQLVWPADLSVIYRPPIKTGVDYQVAVAALLLVMLAGVGWFLFRRRRDLFFWFALFFIGLLPVSQIVPLITLMNDRYLYFPMLGAAGLCGGGAAILADSFPKVGGKRLLAVACFAVILPLAVLSWRRAAVWHDSLALWSDAVQKVPGSKEAWVGLGEARLEKGDLGGAQAAFERALALDLMNPFALRGIGLIHMRRNDPMTARTYFEQTVRFNPWNVDGFVMLGKNYLMTGDLRQAEAMFSRALALDPKAVDAYVGLGKIYWKLGRAQEAMGYYQRALALDPQEREALKDLRAMVGR